MIDGFLRGLLLFFIALSALAQAPLAFFDFSSLRTHFWPPIGYAFYPLLWRMSRTDFTTTVFSV
jgi:hypothetical protein